MIDPSLSRLRRLRVGDPKLCDVNALRADPTEDEPSLCDVNALRAEPDDGPEEFADTPDDPSLCDVNALRADLNEEASDDPTPLDIWGDTFLAPELTPDMLPDVIANYAWDEAARIGVDPACIAIPMLGVCAAGLDDINRIQHMTKNTRWSERACLWLGAMGPPSSRKTPSLESAVEPAKIVQKKWRKEDNIAMAQYLRALDEWKRNKEGDEPIRPPPRRLITTDYTMESLQDILIDNERGILIYTDELVGYISGLDAYKQTKGKDRSAALELFNGNDLPVDRKGVSKYVPNWSACVIGGIQDDKMKQIAGSLAVDGMLARFALFKTGAMKRGEDRKPNMEAIADYLSMYQTLVTQYETEPVRLSEDAYKWRDDVIEITEALADDPSLSSAFRSHAGKLIGIWARLTLTLHAIKCSAAGQPINRPVSEETAKQTRDLIVKFFVPHELAIYADLFNGSGETPDDVKWIAGHILAHNLDVITERDVYRATREYQNERHRVMPALKALECLGWLEGMQDSKRKPIYKVNPTVHSAYAERRQIEKENRLDTATKMARARSVIKRK